MMYHKEKQTNKPHHIMDLLLQLFSDLQDGTKIVLKVRGRLRRGRVLVNTERDLLFV